MAYMPAWIERILSGDWARLPLCISVADHGSFVLINASCRLAARLTRSLYLIPFLETGPETTLGPLPIRSLCASPAAVIEALALAARSVHRSDS
jgi:hypothetical protein